MFKKKLISLGLAGVMLLGDAAFAADVAGNKEASKTTISSINLPAHDKADLALAKKIQTEDNLVKYNIQVPKVQGLEDIVYQEQLNNIILNQALKDIAEVETQAKELALAAEKAGWEYRNHEIFIDYEMKSNDDILSFVINTYMYTGGANGITRVDCYNIDTGKSAPVELKDLFTTGVDYQAIINKEILAKIKEQEENEEAFYFKGEEGFKTISAKQAYYIQDENLVILFQKYEIAPGAMGTPEFKIPLASLNGISHEKQQTKFLSFTGIVKEIVTDEQNKNLWLEDKDGNPANFIISKDTYIVNDQKITEGSTVIGFYDANLPMLMIYPPRYNCEVVAVVNEKENIIVDSFGKKLVVLFEQAVAPTNELRDLSNMEIIVNGKKVETPKAYPNKQGMAMVPLRAISEALEMEVRWNDATKSVMVGKDISFTVGKDSYSKMQDIELKLGAAPEIKDNKVFVPLSFFKKVAGMNNAYVFESQIVIDNNEKME